MNKRQLMLFTMGVILHSAGGCAWVNTPVGVDPPQGAGPGQSTVTAQPDSTRSTPSSSADIPKLEPAPARPPASTKSTGSPPESAPVLTVRMSAAEESRLREQIARDVDRAHEAVGIIRQKALTREQAENLSVVVDFLKGAAAARDTDLRRAGTLAEKARILAEELKATVAR